MSQQYQRLDHYGKGIFTAVRNGDVTEEKQVAQGLINELLAIFHEEVLLVVRESGDIPNIEALVSAIRSPLIHGIMAEAIVSSSIPRNKEGVATGEFPLRNAVNRSREKVERLLGTIAAKGSDAALSLVREFLEASTNESSMIHARSREVLEKYQRSQENLGKTNKHLSEAIEKFKTFKQELTGQIETLNWELQATNRLLAETEVRAASGDRARKILDAINEKLQLVAPSGNTAPQRLQSILTEIDTLRTRQQEDAWEIRGLRTSKETLSGSIKTLQTRQATLTAENQKLLERISSQDVAFSQMAQKYEQAKTMNELLQNQLIEQERAMKAGVLDSILEEDEGMNHKIIESYRYALDRYFGIMLMEYPKEVKRDGEIEATTAAVRSAFRLMQAKDLHPIEIGVKHLEEKKNALKERHRDLKSYNLQKFQIEWIYLESLRFLHGLIWNPEIIATYKEVAGMR